jgi:lysophospholipase L1-like esterase
MTLQFTGHLLSITAAIVAAMPALAQNDAPVNVADFKQPVKLACVGDSIIRGVGAKVPWPTQLGQMPGDRWKVDNHGVSGATLMNSADRPYQKPRDFEKAVGSMRDGVVIMLGANDTKPHNRRHFESDFEKAYRGMIATFAGLESNP